MIIVGTCLDGVNGYTCNCPAAYTQPCLNGGTCLDGANFYSCEYCQSILHVDIIVCCTK